MGLSGLGCLQILCETLVALSRREVQIDELCLRVRYMCHSLNSLKGVI